MYAEKGDDVCSQVIVNAERSMGTELIVIERGAEISSKSATVTVPLNPAKEGVKIYIFNTIQGGLSTEKLHQLISHENSLTFQ